MRRPITRPHDAGVALRPQILVTGRSRHPSRSCGPGPSRHFPTPFDLGYDTAEGDKVSNPLSESRIPVSHRGMLSVAVALVLQVVRSRNRIGPHLGRVSHASTGLASCPSVAHRLWRAKLGAETLRHLSRRFPAIRCNLDRCVGRPCKRSPDHDVRRPREPWQNRSNFGATGRGVQDRPGNRDLIGGTISGGHSRSWLGRRFDAGQPRTCGFAPARQIRRSPGSATCKSTSHDHGSLFRLRGGEKAAHPPARGRPRDGAIIQADRLNPSSTWRRRG